MSALRRIRPPAARSTAERARDALLAALAPHAAPFTPLAASSTEWASGLFTGARHRIAIALEGEDAAGRALRLHRDLPDLEFAVPYGFVADVQVACVIDDAAPALAIEALTIEDAVTRGLPLPSRGGRPAC